MGFFFATEHGTETLIDAPSGPQEMRTWGALFVEFIIEDRAKR